MASEAQPFFFFGQAGFTLHMNFCVRILPTSSLMKHVSPVDVPTKLKAAVADSSVCGGGDLIFRKLCNGFGLNLKLERGNKVDFVLKKWSLLLFPNM